MIAFCQQCAHPKNNGSREPEVFWMCASPQVGLCHIQELWLWHGGACVGNKTDKSEMIASSHGRNWYNLQFWEWICKIRMGIHRQSHGGSNGVSDIWINLKWLKKQENRVHIEVLYILESQFWTVRAGVSGFLTFENNWHDWKNKNANDFLGFKTPKNMHIKFLSISGVSTGKRHDFISNQGKAFAHWSRMTVSTRHRIHKSSFFSNQHTLLHFFSNQHTHYHIDFALFINNGGRTWKTKWFQHNIYIFISISISRVCRLGHCTTFAKCQSWYIICWDNWGTKTTNITASGRTSWVQSCPIWNIARKCKQGEECYENIKEDEYDCNRPHKSASSCFLCKRPHLARKQDASKELEWVEGW